VSATAAVIRPGINNVIKNKKRGPDPMSGMNRQLSNHACDFIDAQQFEQLLAPCSAVSLAEVQAVISKAMAKQPLSVSETALLLRADDPASIEAIFAAARQLKRQVYGNRIVLFAPLYIGNRCINNCRYCAFRRDNHAAIRRTLSTDDLVGQVQALERNGHKRLIMVYGEHPSYDAEFIADTVRTVYATHCQPHGEIRRVNINAAPLDHAGYRAVKAAGIGTYQIFMETYHRPTYAAMHPDNTPKGDFLWRLDGLSRAMEAGCDDVGIGALFGLYDWRFEVLGLVAHALFLQQHYNVGPHTISFPRLRPAQGVELDSKYAVSDDQFKRVIAILRLAVPYTGLILTARENAQLRRELLAFGVSQIDAGSRIELGGYTEAGDSQCMEQQQFELGDIRPLDLVMRDLLEDGYIPSFCTSCYRLGRTGEHFMEFAVPGFIKRFCTPNALVTLQEYLIDYASEPTRRIGEALINQELAQIEDGDSKQTLEQRLQRIRGSSERDCYF